MGAQSPTHPPLGPEDHSKKTEANGRHQTQIQIQENSAEIRHKPDQLTEDTEKESRHSFTQHRDLHHMTTSHQIHSVASPQDGNILTLHEHSFQIHRHYSGQHSLMTNTQKPTSTEGERFQH